MVAKTSLAALQNFSPFSPPSRCDFSSVISSSPTSFPRCPRFLPLLPHQPTTIENRTLTSHTNIYRRNPGMSRVPWGSYTSKRNVGGLFLRLLPGFCTLRRLYGIDTSRRLLLKTHACTRRASVLRNLRRITNKSFLFFYKIIPDPTYAIARAK